MNPPPQIQRLLDDRSLEPLTPDAVAIEGLWIKAIHSDLDAREAMVSTDNRVGLAYQSGLQAVHALLQAYGYRVRSRTSHHHSARFMQHRRSLAHPETMPLIERRLISISTAHVAPPRCTKQSPRLQRISPSSSAFWTDSFRRSARSSSRYFRIMLQPFCPPALARHKRAEDWSACARRRVRLPRLERRGLKHLS